MLVEVFKGSEGLFDFDEKSVVKHLLEKIGSASDESISLLLTTILMQPILFREMYEIGNLREELMQILMYS